MIVKLVAAPTPDNVTDLQQTFVHVLCSVVTHNNELLSAPNRKSRSDSSKNEQGAHALQQIT